MRRRLQTIKKSYGAAGRRHVQTVKRVAKKPMFSIPFVTFMVLAAVVGVAYILTSKGSPTLKVNDSNVVVLNYDEQEQTIPTRAKTVGELLNRLDIKLNTGDVVEPAKDAEIVGDNFRVNIYRAVPVTIVDGAKKTFTYSAAATPRSIVKQAGVQVYPEDKLELLPTENFLAESSIGERVVIDRAAPISVNLYGTPVTMRTHAKTVGELLEEKKIKIGEGDTVQPSVKTTLSSAVQVFLVRKGTEIRTIAEDIPAPVETIDDNSLTFGVTVVRQQGAPGQRLVTYQVELQNGQETSRTKIQEVIAREPVKQVVARGTYFDIAKSKTAVMAAAGISQSSFVYADYVIEHESRWNPAALNSRGCAGLGQACPGSKLAAACPAWRTDAVCQMKYFHSYAIGRYGSWQEAYNFKKAKGWW
ncbi:MAG TPA: ubiquitin-like domain-containing protein [Candidatus Saccharimonadales bacterium]|nr:ubiquitin-like domain-containing protein [Candidatus Saccharimonadales bacterium]